MCLRVSYYKKNIFFCILKSLKKGVGSGILNPLVRGTDPLLYSQSSSSELRRYR
jgi:hypothetical protein